MGAHKQPGALPFLLPAYLDNVHFWKRAMWRWSWWTLHLRVQDGAWTCTSTIKNYLGDKSCIKMLVKV